MGSPEKLDARVLAIVKKKRGAPKQHSLERALLIEESPSPAMLEDTAQWLEVIDKLVAAGLTPPEILRVALRCDRDRLGPSAPDAAVLTHLFAIDEGAAIAREVLAELAALPERTWRDEKRLIVALARLAKDGPLDERYDALFTWAEEPSLLRAIVAALPLARRARIVEAHATPSTAPNVDRGRNALFLAQTLLWVVDLLVDQVPDARARVDALVALAKQHATAGSLLADEIAVLEKELASGEPSGRKIEQRPTRAALRAYEYLTGQKAKQQRAGDIDALAEATWAERRIRVAAPELATVAAWAAAGAKRQKQIALAVAKAASNHTKTRCTLVDLRAYGGAPVATFRCGEHELCLVPGGTFEMGFSEEEEAAVRAQAEVNAGRANWYELYGSLLDNVDAMRPVVTVTVGPLLVARGPGEMFELDEATDALADSAFRLPSEAEWEYLARGGRHRELTWFGDFVPDDPSHYLYMSGLTGEDANPLGVWGFGIVPELCADVWAESHDGAASDGSPRRGAGPRVARGGAGQLYMWQDTGEWQLLLSALRSRAAMWKYEIALRFALGIELGSEP